eukprot:CAMPEP_0116887706 /NCGR_PEP_ID=MMETSP0463-20121206/22329_1 /TAXON_ID=181622 /ORGANISM="Strombidinopsis sp, Strain SopsisLIS2011" /LENGTH=206 /DNA_ID=CAMNT_0004550941 /DNA_START=28 /DNA_END=647 /DNA_ORIENTATION=-
MRFTTALLVSATAFTSEAFAKAMQFQSEEYISQSAAEKQIKCGKLSLLTLPPTAGMEPQLATLYTESEEPTFATPGDEMAEARFGYRLKLIHTVGVVGKVKFTSNNNHSYTGIFEGADYGYARLSAAIEPNHSYTGIFEGADYGYARLSAAIEPNHSYTGIFEGADYGYARLSAAIEPNHSYTGIFEGADYGYARLSAAIEPNPEV